MNIRGKTISSTMISMTSKMISGSAMAAAIGCGLASEQSGSGLMQSGACDHMALAQELTQA